MSITVSTPTDRTIVMSRSFAASREVVYACHTRAEHIRRWWGRGNPLDVEIDFTVGGKWRFVEHAPDGDWAFRGEVREIVPKQLIVQTFEFEGMPGHIAVERLTFEEKDGKTVLVTTSTFANKEDRDGMVQSGMEVGANESYQALDAYLKALQS